MTTPPAMEHHDRLRRLATYASVTVAAILILTKLGGYLITGSMSLLSSLVDSSTDLLASLVTLFGVRAALRPPDGDHRYGHGKAEALAALAQAAFVAGSAMLLVIEAIKRLIDPQPVTDSRIGIAVMVLSIVLTGLLLLLQRHVVKTTHSIAVDADRLHYSGDLLGNAAVILALVLAEATGRMWFDSLFALGIAAVLMAGVAGIARHALDVLMDRELPEQDRQNLITLAQAADARVRNIHDLRTRDAGTCQFIEMHLEMDGNLSLKEAHGVTERVERAIRGAYARAEILIHQDPAGVTEFRLDDRIHHDTAPP